MEDQKAKLAAKLKTSHNVLVTVKSNPSVDQLAAAISMTLVLNKLEKHATTVFSGEVPSAIEFLQPERTIEKDTNSLQDFIIALDKSKADKLRYKLEDNFVKIYITPYHTSIDEKDLVFEQGEVNVDLVIALGVHEREELDNAIVAHGRILHDAAIATVNTLQPSTIGTINWSNNTSSSICEMLVPLIDALQPEGLIDVQVANALLTGIVAETNRFSNEKTTSNTMNVSSRLLASGANQQLVSTQLAAESDKSVSSNVDSSATSPKSPEEPQQPGEHHVAFQVNHNEPPPPTPEPTPPPAPAPPPPPSPEVLSEEPKKEESKPDPNIVAQVQIDDQGKLQSIDDQAAANNANPQTPSSDYKLVINPGDEGKQLAEDQPPVASAPPQDSIQSVTSVPDFLDNPTTPPPSEPEIPTPSVDASEQTPDLDAVRQQVNAAFPTAPASMNTDFQTDSVPPATPQFGLPGQPDPIAPVINTPPDTPADASPPPPPVPPPFTAPSV